MSEKSTKRIRYIHTLAFFLIFFGFYFLFEYFAVWPEFSEMGRALTIGLIAYVSMDSATGIEAWFAKRRRAD